MYFYLFFEHFLWPRKKVSHHLASIMQRSRPPNSKGASGLPIVLAGSEGSASAWVPTTKFTAQRAKTDANIFSCCCCCCCSFSAPFASNVWRMRLSTAQRSSHRGAFVSMARPLSSVLSSHRHQRRPLFAGPLSEPVSPLLTLSQLVETARRGALDLRFCLPVRQLCLTLLYCLLLV